MKTFDKFYPLFKKARAAYQEAEKRQNELFDFLAEQGIDPEELLENGIPVEQVINEFIHYGEDQSRGLLYEAIKSKGDLK